MDVREAPRTPRVERILVPIDFGCDPAPILDTAVELARRFGARLDFFHVWQPPAMLPMELFVTVDAGGPLQRAQDVARSLAAAQLAELAGRARAAGVAETQCQVGCGDPATDIVDLATTGGYGLIVMGTHGRGRLQHALLGSVAEKVIRSAPCPVMTVRAR
jgi:nucleotide-binding universal stress UspA family protein